MSEITELTEVVEVWTASAFYTPIQCRPCEISQVVRDARANGAAAIRVNDRLVYERPAFCYGRQAK